MNEKQKKRYLKKITTLCVVMDVIITTVVLSVAILTKYIDSATLGIISGMWSIELFLGFLIKKGENKNEGENNYDIRDAQ